MSDNVMASPLQPDSTDPPSLLFVTDDIPCRKCSYNLRTLPTTGNCPECGTPVGVSIFGNLLRFSDPLWVGKLARGAQCILLGLLLIVGDLIFTEAERRIAHANGATRSQTYDTLYRLFWLAGNVFIAVGSWLLTEPDPSGIGEDEYGAARKIIRITLLLWVADALASLASTLSRLPPIGRQILLVGNTIAVIVSIVGLVAQLQYIAKLAGRIPDLPLASRSNFLKVALSAAYGLLMLMVIGQEFGTLPRSAGAHNSNSMSLLGCSAALIGLALLTFGVMYLLMVDRLRRRFREQAIFARQSWATHPAI